MSIRQSREYAIRGIIESGIENEVSRDEFHFYNYCTSFGFKERMYECRDDLQRALDEVKNNKEQEINDKEQEIENTAADDENLAELENDLEHLQDEYDELQSADDLLTRLGYGIEEFDEYDNGESLETIVDLVNQLDSAFVDIPTGYGRGVSDLNDTIKNWRESPANPNNGLVGKCFEPTDEETLLNIVATNGFKKWFRPEKVASELKESRLLPKVWYRGLSGVSGEEVDKLRATSKYSDYAGEYYAYTPATAMSYIGDLTNGKLLAGFLNVPEDKLAVLDCKGSSFNDIGFKSTVAEQCEVFLAFGFDEEPNNWQDFDFVQTVKLAKTKDTISFYLQYANARGCLLVVDKDFEEQEYSQNRLAEYFSGRVEYALEHNYTKTNFYAWNLAIRGDYWAVMFENIHDFGGNYGKELRGTIGQDDIICVFAPNAYFKEIHNKGEFNPEDNRIFYSLFDVEQDFKQEMQAEKEKTMQQTQTTATNGVFSLSKNIQQDISGSPEIVSVTRDNYAAANRYAQNAAQNPVFLAEDDNAVVMPFDDFVIAAMKDTGDSREEVIAFANEAFRSQYQAADGYLRAAIDGSIMYNAFDIEIDDKTYYATAPLKWVKEQARATLSDKGWDLENARHNFLHSSLANNEWETAFNQLKAAADDYKQWRNQVCAFFNFRQPEITLQQGEWTQIAQFLGYKQELEALDNARLMIAEFTPQQAFEFLGVYQQYQHYVSLAEHNAEQGVDTPELNTQIAALEQLLNEKVAQNLPQTENRQVLFDLLGTQMNLFDEVEKTQEQGTGTPEKNNLDDLDKLHIKFTNALEELSPEKQAELYPLVRDLGFEFIRLRQDCKELRAGNVEKSLNKIFELQNAIISKRQDYFVKGNDTDLAIEQAEHNRRVLMFVFKTKVGDRDFVEKLNDINYDFYKIIETHYQQTPAGQNDLFKRLDSELSRLNERLAWLRRNLETEKSFLQQAESGNVAVEVEYHKQTIDSINVAIAKNETEQNKLKLDANGFNQTPESQVLLQQLKEKFPHLWQSETQEQGVSASEIPENGVKTQSEKDTISVTENPPTLSGSPETEKQGTTTPESSETVAVSHDLAGQPETVSDSLKEPVNTQECLALLLNADDSSLNNYDKQYRQLLSFAVENGFSLIEDEKIGAFHFEKSQSVFYANNSRNHLSVFVGCKDQYGRVLETKHWKSSEFADPDIPPELKNAPEFNTGNEHQDWENWLNSPEYHSLKVSGFVGAVIQELPNEWLKLAKQELAEAENQFNLLEKFYPDEVKGIEYRREQVELQKKEVERLERLVEKQGVSASGISETVAVSHDLSGQPERISQNPTVKSYEKNHRELLQDWRDLSKKLNDDTIDKKTLGQYHKQERLKVDEMRYGLDKVMEIAVGNEYGDNRLSFSDYFANLRRFGHIKDEFASLDARRLAVRHSFQIAYDPKILFYVGSEYKLVEDEFDMPKLTNHIVELVNQGKIKDNHEFSLYANDIINSNEFRLSNSPEIEKQGVSVSENTAQGTGTPENSEDLITQYAQSFVGKKWNSQNIQDAVILPDGAIQLQIGGAWYHENALSYSKFERINDIARQTEYSDLDILKLKAFARSYKDNAGDIHSDFGKAESAYNDAHDRTTHRGIQGFPENGWNVYNRVTAALAMAGVNSPVYDINFDTNKIKFDPKTIANSFLGKLKEQEQGISVSVIPENSRETQPETVSGSIETEKQGISVSEISANEVKQDLAGQPETSQPIALTKEQKAELKAAKTALDTAKKELKGLRDELKNTRPHQVSYYLQWREEKRQTISEKQAEVRELSRQYDELSFSLKTQTGEITDLEKEILTARLSGSLKERFNIAFRELKAQQKEIGVQYNELKARIDNKDLYEFEIQSVMQDAVAYYGGSRGMAMLYHKGEPLPLTTDRDKAIAYLLQVELPRQLHDEFGKSYNALSRKISKLGNAEWRINTFREIKESDIDLLEDTENQLMKGSIEERAEINLTYDINTEYGKQKIRELFYNSKHDEAQAELFEKVFAMAQKLNVEVRHALRNPHKTFSQRNATTMVLGWYQMKENSARVKHGGNIKVEEKGEVLLHELVHSVTSRAIFLKEQGHTELLNPAQVKAIEEIEKIYQAVLDKAEELGFEKFQKITKDGVETYQGDYGLQNAHEFIAELANPVFREKLKQVAMFDDTVKAITEVATGVEKTETAYDRLTAALYQIMDNYEPDFGARYEQAKYGNIKMHDIFSQPKQEQKMKISNDLLGGTDGFSVHYRTFDNDKRDYGLYYKGVLLNSFESPEYAVKAIQRNETALLEQYHTLTYQLFTPQNDKAAEYNLISKIQEARYWGNIVESNYGYASNAKIAELEKKLDDARLEVLNVFAANISTIDNPVAKKEVLNIVKEFEFMQKEHSVLEKLNKNQLFAEYRENAPKDEELPHKVINGRLILSFDEEMSQRQYHSIAERQPENAVKQDAFAVPESIEKEQTMKTSQDILAEVMSKYEVHIDSKDGLMNKPLHWLSATELEDRRTVLSARIDKIVQNSGSRQKLHSLNVEYRNVEIEMARRQTLSGNLKEVLEKQPETLSVRDFIVLAENREELKRQLKNAIEKGGMSVKLTAIEDKIKAFNQPEKFSIDDRQAFFEYSFRKADMALSENRFLYGENDKSVQEKLAERTKILQKLATLSNSQKEQTAEKGVVSSPKEDMSGDLFLSSTQALLYWELENAIHWRYQYIAEQKEIPIPQSFIDTETARIEYCSKELNERLYGDEYQKYRDMFPEKIKEIQDDFNRMVKNLKTSPETAVKHDLNTLPEQEQTMKTENSLPENSVKQDAFGLPENYQVRAADFDDFNPNLDGKTITANTLYSDIYTDIKPEQQGKTVGEVLRSDENALWDAEFWGELVGHGTVKVSDDLVAQVIETQRSEVLEEITTCGNVPFTKEHIEALYEREPELIKEIADDYAVPEIKALAKEVVQTAEIGLKKQAFNNMFALLQVSDKINALEKRLQKQPNASAVQTELKELKHEQDKLEEEYDKILNRAFDAGIPLKEIRNGAKRQHAEFSGKPIQAMQQLVDKLDKAYPINKGEPFVKLDFFDDSKENERSNATLSITATELFFRELDKYDKRHTIDDYAFFDVKIVDNDGKDLKNGSYGIYKTEDIIENHSGLFGFLLNKNSFSPNPQQEKADENLALALSDYLDDKVKNELPAYLEKIADYKALPSATGVVSLASKKEAQTIRAFNERLQEHLQNKEVKRDAFGLPETTKTLSLQEQALADGKRLQQADEKVKSAEWECAKKPNIRELYNNLQAAIAERDALNEEIKPRVQAAMDSGKPYIVEYTEDGKPFELVVTQSGNLKMALGSYDEEPNHNHLLSTANGEVALNAEQRSTPKRTAEVLKYNFKHGCIDIGDKLALINYPNADKVFSENQIKDTLNKALKSSFKEDQLAAIHSPRMKDEWLKSVGEKHNNPEVVAAAHKVLAERQALSSLTLSDNLEPENHTANKGGFSSPEHEEEPATVADDDGYERD